MKRVLAAAACAMVAASGMSGAGADPLPEPIAERIESAISVDFAASKWRFRVSAVDEQDTFRGCVTARRSELLAPARHRFKVGVQRIVTDMQGCARRAVRYDADPTTWTVDVGFVVDARGDRYVQERFADGRWHGVRVLAFPRERIAVQLLLTGESAPTPGATAAPCLYYAPPFVWPCGVGATAERSASVTGDIRLERTWSPPPGEQGTIRFRATPPT